MGWVLSLELRWLRWLRWQKSVVPLRQIDDAGVEKKTDTDKNMSTMFEILRRKKRVGLDSLILNRQSFAQTVENLFALSFLVKDGRAEVTVDEKGYHFVCKIYFVFMNFCFILQYCRWPHLCLTLLIICIAAPKNAPVSSLVLSGEVVYGHFVFRFDYRDWKVCICTFKIMQVSFVCSFHPSRSLLLSFFISTEKYFFYLLEYDHSFFLLAIDDD